MGNHDPYSNVRHLAQHSGKELESEMALGEQQPVIPRMLYQPVAGLHQRLALHVKWVMRCE
jgi:hypothetical protein